MIRHWVQFAIVLLVFGVGTDISLAKPVKATPPVTQFRQGDQFHVKDDKAYVAMRYESNTTTMTIMLLRVPSSDEMAAYEEAKRVAYHKQGKKAGAYENFAFSYGAAVNLYELNPKKSFHKDGKTATILAEIPAGEYIVYGLGWNGYLQQCLCFGTVGFTASNGTISDIGKILVAKAWEPSGFPELKGEDNLGPTAQMDYGLFAVGMTSYIPTNLPSAASGNALLQAKLRAIGPFIETNTLLMNRMAAVPGVLAYNQGRVVDVVSGKEVPPNF